MLSLASDKNSLTAVFMQPPEGPTEVPCKAVQLLITTSVMVNLALSRMIPPPITGGFTAPLPLVIVRPLIVICALLVMVKARPKKMRVR